VNCATFFISTGRCGTQWLARALGTIASDRAEITHEPLHLGYEPRKMLAVGEPELLDSISASRILSHVGHIEDTLQRRSYVECGYPVWSTIPYLARRFAGHVRVVHLVRHPVPTAYSWIAQQAYCPPLAPHLRVKELLTPFDPGIRFMAFRERWDSLTPYEKSLFYWAEVNAFALRLQEQAQFPWLRVRFEDLFTLETLRELAAFCGIGAVDRAIAVPAPADDFPTRTSLWSDPALISMHAEVAGLAAALGYDSLAFDERSLRARYFGMPGKGI
jgi:hypothetical protein